MLSLVIPTYNEKKSLQVFLPRLKDIVSKMSVPVEFIVVDDNSPDGTADFVAQFEMEQPATIRVVKRAGKFGVASAVIEGWRSARGELLGVMDADGSHDESVLPEMTEALMDGPAEVAVGSRYITGGGLGDWPLERKLLSGLAVLMGKILCPAKDVTSGYLLFRREVLEGVSLDPVGSKIGLEVMVRGRYRTFTEIPYIFRDPKRKHRTLRAGDIAAYLVQLGRLLVYRYRHPHQRRRWTRVVS
jgi:dolichol-phosphate mannosyltransferase